MKILKEKQLYFIDNKFYKLDKVGGEVAIGGIIYDSRTGDFLLIENRRDEEKFGYVAPELYATVTEVKPETNIDEFDLDWLREAVVRHEIHRGGKSTNTVKLGHVLALIDQVDSESQEKDKLNKDQLSLDID